MLRQSSEHAANSMVGMQTAVLQEAAANAVRQAIHNGLGSRLRTYFAFAAITSGLLSAVTVMLTLKLT